MFDPAKIIEKAKHSAFWRWVLNQSLYRMVPFNRPHRFSVVEVEDHYLKALIPYRKSNFNHIRSLHACALATLSEFATGFLLLSNLDIKKYRLIMQRIEMDYHYQGKMDAFAEFRTSREWLEQQIIGPLRLQESVVVPCEVKIHDAKGNHITTGMVFWQIKDWSKVKTKT
jgi:acyl-coenzyme A thioesterase PaaI-like protein